MEYTPQLVDAEKLRVGTYISAGDASYGIHEGHVVSVAVAGDEVIVDILDRLGERDTYRCPTGNSIWTTGFAENFLHGGVDISTW
jgi:hypothetical protein